MVQGKKSQGLPKSDGTTSTNYGATFEISSTAISVLRACKKGKEFTVWMNNKKYEPWDDIVMEIDRKIVCVQLKHNEKFDKRKLDTCLEQRKKVLNNYPADKDRIVFVFFATAADDASIRASYQPLKTIPEVLNLLLTNKDSLYYDSDNTNGETYFCMKQHNISTETKDIKDALAECIGQQYLSEDHLKDIQIKFLDYLQKRYQRRLNGEAPLTTREISTQLGYAILNKFKVEYKPTDGKVEVSNNLNAVIEKSSIIVFDHRWSSAFKDYIWYHLMAYLEENVSKKHLKSSKLDDLWTEGKIHMPIVSSTKDLDKVILRALQIASFEPKVVILRPRIFKIMENQDIITILQNLSSDNTMLKMKSAEDEECFKYSDVPLNALINNNKIKLHQDAFCKVAKEFFKGDSAVPERIIEAHDENHFVNDANVVGDQVMPALFAAIKINQIDIKIIQHIIDLGADVNASILGGFRPVFFAVDENRPDILELLLQKGANPDPADKYGMRPLFNACIQNKPDMVDILIRYNADRNNSDVNGVRPLFMAYGNRNFEVVRILLNGFDKPAAANTQGSHILHKAAEDGSVECLKCILEYCPDIQIFMKGDVDGFTPLDLARKNGHQEFVDVLENAIQ